MEYDLTKDLRGIHVARKHYFLGQVQKNVRKELELQSQDNFVIILHDNIRSDSIVSKDVAGGGGQKTR